MIHEVRFEEIILDRIKYGVQSVLNKRDVNPMNMQLIDYHCHELADRFILAMKGEHLGKQFDAEIILNRPDGWKELFKEQHKNRWWMRWWIKRHPIQREHIKVDLLKYVIFPDITVPKNFDGTTKVTFYEIRSSDAWIRSSNDRS